MNNTNFLDNLQAYNTCYGNETRLDMLRELANAGIDFFYRGYGVPTSLPPDINGLPRTQLSSLETYETQLSVPPGCLITALSAYSEQTAGFSIQIVDAASGISVFSTQDIRSNLLGTYQGVAEDVPAGPTLIKVPLFVLDKGLLQITLKNLATVANMVQLYIETAVPNTRGNTNRKEVN